MIETSPLRKNKICLNDYDYQKDIENRVLMAQFSAFDLEVLEEILYSSLNIPLQKLIKNLNCDEEKLLPVLEKFSKTGLLKIVKEDVCVDKEMRKYYELQILKFDEEFVPGMEFLQTLLRKPPIHVLPTWYSIPRTSNNIFDSLVEKYLLTPQIFQRYLAELSLGDSNLYAIIHDVYSSPDFKVASKDLIEKYGFSREQFEEYLLHLEFNFVCCVGYIKVEDQWREVVTPFHEWREYLRFIRETEVRPIADPSKILNNRGDNFSFIQEMSTLLEFAKKEPIPMCEEKEALMLPQEEILPRLHRCLKEGSAPIPYLLSKIQMLRLGGVLRNRFCAFESANDWLDLSLENRALQIYRHPLGHLVSKDLPTSCCTERHIREAEKNLVRVLNSGWIYFDDFLKGVLVPLSDPSMVTLKRVGKNWRYTLPVYNEEEKILMKEVLFRWLFEIGAVAIGSHQDRDCFCVTPFGRSLFGR